MKRDQPPKRSKPVDGEYQLNIWLPAGIGLICIGCLTLITPLLVSLNQAEFWIDMVSGGILTLAGVVALVKGAYQ